ncbi:hypothetical protein RFI_40424, partial [Reticulomyxa filosa]
SPWQLVLKLIKKRRVQSFCVKWEKLFDETKETLKDDIKSRTHDKVPINLITRYQEDFENRSLLYKAERIDEFTQICDERETLDTANDMERLVDKVAEQLISQDCKDDETIKKEWDDLFTNKLEKLKKNVMSFKTE